MSIIAAAATSAGPGRIAQAGFWVADGWYSLVCHAMRLA
jgi:hypothetical protein